MGLVMRAETIAIRSGFDADPPAAAETAPAGGNARAPSPMTVFMPPPGAAAQFQRTCGTT
jgi:hypothetical protein